MNEPIILEIGIDLCLNCPYSDCIGTDTDLCHLMKTEVKRVRAQVEEERRAREREVLTNIQANVPATIPEICEIHGYEYAEIEELRRHKKLKFRRVKGVGKKKIILIIGVNLDTD